MKRMTYFVMALVLVLGFTQCKKEQVNTPENETKTVNITLNVGGNGGGSRHTIDTENGDVDFQDGDVIYVGDGSTYIGTLTRTDGVFSGPITEPADGTEIYFFFVGGLPTTPADLSGQSSFTVDISDQSTEMPVLSCNHVTYSSSTTSYSCVLQNQCALVEFTTVSTTDPVHVGGLYTGATINFGTETPGITNNGTTGFVALNSKSATEKWAVLLPQDDFSNIEGVVADKGYTISMQPETTISADGFITGEQAIGITSTPSHNRYLQWAVRDLTLEGGDHVYGTLAGNYQISIANGATVTLDGVNINGVNSEDCKWAGITCLGNAIIILKEGTTNIVTGFYGAYPGIQAGSEGTTLTIQGTGSLTASSNKHGAGIGGGALKSCGNIVIQGGIITATTGDGGCGAGIGSGIGYSCGDITISGGTVTATGGYEFGAGIGSGMEGSCGNITITSDVTKVTATKGDWAPYSIGGNCGTVTIGGTVYPYGATPNQADDLTFVYPVTITWNSSQIGNIVIEVEGSTNIDGITMTLFGDGSHNSFSNNSMYIRSMSDDTGLRFSSDDEEIKITKIEIVHSGMGYYMGNGGWQDGYYYASEGGTFTWSGTPSTTVTLSRGECSIETITSIVFTIE